MRRLSLFLLLGLLPSLALAVDLSALEAQIKPSVVHLAVVDSRDKEIGNGSGFVIDPSGLVVTNHHVIADATDMIAKFADGSSRRVLGKRADDPADDLAIIQIEGSGYPALTLADPASIKEGEEIAVLGSPLGFSFSLSSGNISALRLHGEISEHFKDDAVLKNRPLIQITASLQHGSSGSPVVDFTGHVVGVAASIIGDLNFAVFVAPLIKLRGDVGPTTPLTRLAMSPTRNLAISAAFFGAVGLILVSGRLMAWWRQRRRRVAPPRPTRFTLKN
jgi:S1-C subfamily serine protease